MKNSSNKTLISYVKEGDLVYIHNLNSKNLVLGKVLKVLNYTRNNYPDVEVEIETCASNQIALGKVAFVVRNNYAGY